MDGAIIGLIALHALRRYDEFAAGYFFNGTEQLPFGVKSYIKALRAFHRVKLNNR